MSKEKKKRPGYMTVIYATLMAIGIYLIAIMGLAYIVTSGTLKEGRLLVPMLAVCMVAAWSSGIWAIKFSPNRERAYAIIVSVLFSCIVFLISKALGGTAVWQGSGVWLLLAALLGGGVACLTVKRKKRRGKRLSK